MSPSSGLAPAPPSMQLTGCVLTEVSTLCTWAGPQLSPYPPCMGQEFMDLGREVPSKLCEQEAGVITGSPRESTQLCPSWLPQSWSARSPLVWGTAGQGQGTLWARAAGKLWYGSGPRWQEVEFLGGGAQSFVPCRLLTPPSPSPGSGHCWGDL